MTNNQQKNDLLRNLMLRAATATPASILLFDMNKMHYICEDTDSITWAISGNPNAEEGYRQKIKYIIMDQKFFEENYSLFFDQYKLLLRVSHEAE
ncbi:MAG: hypothetical protein EZS28_006705 [Streblomastix strix]|uniref:Uncharacterized protein n=1 Tax=Streblomastix strix TaxID=222440 RepID=A0A5J4WS70_9EUKA|nr:MAG: hypothetical protein EZS28_006705 [Streblomastix strix]